MIPQFTWCTLLFLVVALSAIAATLDLVSIAGNQITGTCLSQESRDEAIQNIREAIIETTPNLVISLHCGSGQWYRVAHLNMNNSSQQCPSAWREYNNITDGIRACGRPEISNGSCPATFYATSRQYSRVCGRAIGYQYGTPDAFGLHAAGHMIDSYYVYGVSVTHGTPRNHIWTLAAGLSEGGFSQQYNCPCSNSSHPDNVFPPSFVGNNYYCESGNPTDTILFTPLMLSGMASNVKVSVAAMENLLHGSVWSYPTQQLTILRCTYAYLRKALMMLPSSYLNCMFSEGKLTSLVEKCFCKN